MTILLYNGNVLSLKVEAHGDGFVGSIDNWDADWQVRVDRRPVRIEKFFGAFKSVRLSAGVLHVDSVY